MSTAPIGIFDSGMGGLTIVKAIHNLLPQENLIYFGDTKHNPWGDKSKETIKHYSLRICDILLEHQCKAIVVACNTASAVAFKEIQAHSKNIPIINVIDPVINYIGNTFNNARIGLVGTKQTIASKSYLEKLQALQAQNQKNNIQLQALATPLLVPLIEEGLADSLPAKLILHMYLANEELKGIQALILGCTHYPLLKAQVENFYEHKIPIIDSTKLTAICLQQILSQKNLLNKGNTPAQQIFYISDHNPHFVKLAKLFFYNEITLLPLSFLEQNVEVMAMPAAIG